MKYFLIYCFVFLPSLIFSQESKPDGYSKIHFVYNKKANYHIDENGVFADTVLLKFDFPAIKYTLRRSPNDVKSIVGFVPLKDFDKESKAKLSSTIYHTVEKIHGTYDLKKNTTTLRISRNDEDAKKVLKNFFQEGYHSFDYTISIDYQKKMWRCKYPLISYKYKFNEILRTINFFNENKTEGSYLVKRKTLVLDNLVYLDEKLNNKITPGEIFLNNDFGVEKIVGIHETISLESVVYK